MPPRKDTTSSDDAVQSLIERLDQFLTHHADTRSQSTTQFESLQAAMTQQMNLTTQLLAAIAKDKDTSSSSFSNPPPPPPPPPTNNLRPPKIQLPTFDGFNPLDWMFQADNYFTYYNIPDAQRLALSVFYFKGDALSWYKHLANNNLLGTWQQFTCALKLRFGPSTFENHQATLFKLRQTSTVTVYQTEFELISNRVTGLSPEILRNCFISGLKQEIQAEISVHNPRTLRETYDIAKLIEDKLNATSKPRFFSSQRPHVTPTTLQNPSQTQSSPSTNQVPPLLPTPTKTNTFLPFNKLTSEALQKRKSEGLCFWCPDKYHSGHKCNPPQFLVIVDNEDEQETNNNLLDTIEPPDPDPDHIPHFIALSEAAFFGLTSTKTLRVTEHLKGHPVTTLVDCGSTHNIIQPRVASFL